MAPTIRGERNRPGLQGFTAGCCPSPDPFFRSPNERAGLPTVKVYGEISFRVQSLLR